MVIGKLPPLPAAGVPARVAVPLPLSVKVTPPGRVPVSVSAGTGEPVAVMVSLNAVPTVDVAAAALVIASTPGVLSVTDAPAPMLCHADRPAPYADPNAAPFTVVPAGTVIGATT